MSLSVEPGEIFGFLGANGAGKTTTIRMMLGLARADAGSAYLLGERVPAGPVTLRSVGCMIEEPSFYPWLSGAANLRALTYGAVSRADVHAALERAGIAHVGQAKVATYSQGMRQRLALALAVCGRPRLLVLDEPGNGLDPAGVRDLRRLLREIADEGGTVFLSSHQLTEVERACGRAAILHEGRVVAEGSVTALGGDVRWVHVTVDPGRRADALAALAAMGPEDLGDEIRVRCDSGQEVTRALVAAGVIPDSVTQRASTLEERFLALTEGTAG